MQLATEVWMPKRKGKKAKREAVKVSDRVGPTPETLAKLQPDPLVIMHTEGLIDDAARDGALEIRKVYMAVAGSLLTKARGEGGRAVMNPEIAWIHANRYLPWTQGWGHNVLSRLLDMVVDGEPPGWGQKFADGTIEFDLPSRMVAEALQAYARIRKATPLPRNLDWVA